MQELESNKGVNKREYQSFHIWALCVRVRVRVWVNEKKTEMKNKQNCNRIWNSDCIYKIKSHGQKSIRWVKNVCVLLLWNRKCPGVIDNFFDWILFICKWSRFTWMMKSFSTLQNFDDNQLIVNNIECPYEEYAYMLEHYKMGKTQWLIFKRALHSTFPIAI